MSVRYAQRQFGKDEEETVRQYRHYLKDLLPLVKHTPINAAAFTAKLAQLCEAPNHKPL